MTLAQSLKLTWGGGNRLLILLVSILSLVAIASTATSLFLIINRSQHPPNPLQSPSPEQIQGKLAAYRVGDSINILGAKCNRSTKTVIIRGESWWQNMDQGAEGTKIPSGGNSVTGRALPPGCMPLNFPHKIPPTVTPGRWAFVGQDCIYPGPSFCTDWYSEVFVVVP